MGNIPLSDFYTQNYGIIFLNYLNQQWSRGRVWQCMEKPKEENLLLYFKSGSAVYSFNDGETLTVNAGDVCYTPVGCRYSVCFEGRDIIETSALKFRLFDEQGKDVAFAVKPMNFPDQARNVELFESARKLSEKAIQIPAKYNVLLHEFISYMGHESVRHAFKDFSLIENGIKYLNAHIEENTSVENIAQMYNISSTYFRRVFKEFMGLSPSEYRIKKRIEKAKVLLEYGEDSIECIGQSLGYIDTSYFIKQFKRAVGLTPNEYRKMK